MSFRNKRLLSLFLSLVLVLGIFLVPVHNLGFAEEGQETVVDDLEDVEVINEEETEEPEEAEEIIILHTNDMHAKYEEGTYDGMGFAKLAAKIKEIREKNENVLLLDAGDGLHGMPLATLSEGETIVNLMNLMGYDVMVPGNHDFNYGYDRLLELKDIAEFDMIAGNVVKEDGTRDFESYIIKEFGDVKVGIFGIATPETKYKSSPKNTEGVEFEDPVEVAKKLVQELQEKEVDIIIGLTHLGLDEDSEDTSEKIAQEVEGIDVIVDGHSHTILEEGKMVKDTLIVQTHEHTKNLGIVTLKIEEGKIVEKEATLFTKEEAADLEENEEVKTLIEELYAGLKDELERVIGETKSLLDGERANVRAGETNLGNLLTDIMREIGEADVALTNGGGIRDSIVEGEITVNHIIKAFPFENYLVVIEVEGIDILNALEHGTDAYPELKGAFPHVSGMTYKIDLSKEIGNRITDVKIGDEDLDINKVYKLATNNFLRDGGDDYTMFEGKKLVIEKEALNELLIKYIEEQGVIDYEVEGRITVEEGLPVEEPEEVEEPVVEPEPEPILVPGPVIEAYIVKAGDVLWKIAEKFGLTWGKLAEYNKLKNPHLIFPGQKILVPVK